MKYVLVFLMMFLEADVTYLLPSHAIIPRSDYARIPGYTQDAGNYHDLMRELELRGVKVTGGGNCTYTITLPGEEKDRMKFDAERFWQVPMEWQVHSGGRP